MPKKSVRQTVSCQYFRWIVSARKGTFYADGRSGNPVSVGRHSLDTKVHADALVNLKELDLKKAVEFGIAESPAPSVDDEPDVLPLEQGRQQYIAFVGRPPHMGGVTANTLKRYRAVFDKFIPFARKAGVESWNRVTQALLIAYGTWLDNEGYAPRTGRLELSTLKQILKYLADEEMIPPSCKCTLKLPQQSGTSTYCYTPAEVTAMIAHCDADEKLKWLGHVITGLSHTGLRISELASLKWCDLDEGLSHIILTDDLHSANREQRPTARATKNHRDRTIPIHPKLREVLSLARRTSDQLILHGPRGGVLKPDTVRNALLRDVLNPLAKVFPALPGKSGLIDGRLHSFRHYFCSVSARNGVDENTLMRWLGHHDSAMIRLYFHTAADHGASKMARIEFAGSTTVSVEPGPV